MDQIKMMAELKTNCETNINKLAELFKAYDMAELGYKAQWEQSKECHTEALKNNCFYAAEDCERAGIKGGDRITEEEFPFLLSDDDFDHLQKLTLPILVKKGITDEKGYYLTDWLGLKCEARRALIGFILDNILPNALRIEFASARMNITHEEKLMAILRPLVA